MRRMSHMGRGVLRPKPLFTTVRCCSTRILPASPPQATSEATVQPTRRVPHKACGGAAIGHSRLNTFSSQMRDLLVSPDPFSNEGECRHQQRAILAALMTQSPPPAPPRQQQSQDRSIDISSANTAAATLHPLLCIRILERLGYPLVPSSSSLSWFAEGQGKHNCTNVEKGSALPGGWLADAGLGNPRSDALRIFGHVLVPLQPLLGRPTPSDGEITDSGSNVATMHPQVRPVLPIALAWWAFCPPLPESGRKDDVTGGGTHCWPPLLADLWMTHFLSFYRAEARATLPTQEVDAKGTSHGSNRVSALPLPSLLPFLITKVLRGEVSAALLPAVLRLCLYATEPTGTPEGDTRMVISDPAVVDVLFWSTSVPLVAHHTVRQALREATAANVILADAAVADSRQPPQHANVTVLVGLRDDDALRRFLLRMVALRERQRRDVTSSEGGSSGRLFIEPFVTGEAADPDNILRWVNPLHDYLSLTYADADGAFEMHVGDDGEVHRGGGGGGEAELSFVGILNIVTAILDRLQTLRKASSCNDDSMGSKTATSSVTTTEFHFTLLPHKPRIHAVKRICEVLLRHTRHVLSDPAYSAHHQSISHIGAHRAEMQWHVGNRAAHAITTHAWFHDTTVGHQESILRRLCGAARLLVRVVMEEKRMSLATEGPEGATLTAGCVGAVGVDETDRRPTVVAAAENPSEQSLRGKQIGQGAPGAARVNLGKMTASLVAITTVLRNTAFRVLEPALLRLYEADADASAAAAKADHLLFPPSPLSSCGQQQAANLVPSLPVLLRVPGALEPFLHEPLRGMYANEEPSSGDGHEGCDGDAKSMDSETPPIDSTLAPLCDALLDVHRAVGGEGAWETAQQLLLHPRQQPPAAVLEGVRLLAMEILLFSPFTTWNGASAGRPVEPLLARLELAVQSVWDHCGGGDDNDNTDAAGGEDGGENASVRQLHPLQIRLALLALVTAVRAATAAQPSVTSRTVSSPTTTISTTEAAVRVCTSILQSLAPPSLVDEGGVEVHGGPGDEWAAVGLNSSALAAYEKNTQHATTVRIRRGLGSLSMTLPSRWELLEELRNMAAAAKSGSATGTTTWWWLGSPAAVRYAVHQCVKGEEGMHESSSPCGEGDTRTPGKAKGDPLFLLVPWSTLAEGWQPLRLYDESGKSVREGERLDAELRRLLRFTRPSGWEPSLLDPTATATAAAAASSAAGSPTLMPRVVIRFVSIVEELQHFATVAAHDPVMHLARDITVVHRELMTTKQLAAKHQHHRSSVRERVLNGDSGAEDAYDGLD